MKSLQARSTDAIRAGRRIRPAARRLAWLALGLAAFPVATPVHARPNKAEASIAETLRTIEHQRLDALVKEDAATIARLTADDYMLVSPLGTVDRKQDELRGLGRGFYVALNPGPMEVRAGGPDSGIIRYQLGAVLKVRGQIQPERHFWHIDYYERRHGQWQVVWSQSTEIPPPTPPQTPPHNPNG